jgi:hypothetical protein
MASVLVTSIRLGLDPSALDSIRLKGMGKDLGKGKNDDLRANTRYWIGIDKGEIEIVFYDNKFYISELLS